MRDQSGGVEVSGILCAAGGGGVELREAHRIDPRPVPRRRDRAPGPRPVRPRVAAVSARPVQPARPMGTAGAQPDRRPGQRVLLRPVPVLPAHILRRRQVAAVVGMALLCALVVVALGLLADVAAAARASTGAGSPAGDGSSLTEVAGSSGQVVGPLRR